MISDTLDEPSIALQHWKGLALSDSRAWEFRGECGHQTATNLKLSESRRSTERGGRDADMKEEERVRLNCLNTPKVCATYRRGRPTYYGQVTRTNE